ncbi:tubulin glycylase 3A [Rhagoletis pomonella]|uniref:tubulin glycylase 3A n=1 Tax=Rhagoletis pomonella TaxID=28610 RepID=UPI001784F5D4|nr:tubulin glycylase 3A [Rhagoletis pomonella]
MHEKPCENTTENATETRKRSRTSGDKQLPTDGKLKSASTKLPPTRPTLANEEAESASAIQVVTNGVTANAQTSATESATKINPANSHTTITATSTTATKPTTATITTATGREIIPSAPPSNYCNRRTWITTDRLNELRRRAQEAVKHNKTFTIRGSFHSVRNALVTRGWIEKLDVHRKQIPTGVCQVTYDDLAQGLPKRKPGETRRQYIGKCERNIMSRFLEHMPIDFLWTNRKEKCDYIDQAKNPGMIINKFHRAPFTSKEGLCAQLKDFHWFYEEGMSELYFPRCYNVWSLEELAEFMDNFKLTACIAFVRNVVDRYRRKGLDAIFSTMGTVPYNSIDFALKRCGDYLDSCQHKDIDLEDLSRVWEHEWDVFFHQHQQVVIEEAKIFTEPTRAPEYTMKASIQLLENLQSYWPQYTLDGYQNLWIVKPANKCRGRGIQLMDNLKKILVLVNPSIGSKSRYVVQKYIERPLTIHHTKFDIRQWFLITNVQPLVVWMYKDSYLRFSSQEYSLSNHHESVHLTNHAIQKKYNNGKRDKRLPIENMWDCYSFQAYLRQIGKYDMWQERIYPGMKKAIVGTMLASQENIDRRPNTFELFGADFMICEDFYPWLIEINSSPDLGATTSVTARMCPQCLEDVIKVVIDRRLDPKSDMGNFELIYRQVVPPTPAYMGLNLFVKGKQIVTKLPHHHHHHHHQTQQRDRPALNGHAYRHRATITPAISNVHKAMPTFNATEYVEKYIMEAGNSSRSSISGGIGSGLTTSGAIIHSSPTPMQMVQNARRKYHTTPQAQVMICPNLLKTPRSQIGTRRKSFTNLSNKANTMPPRGAKDQQQASAVPLIKRHRSCGPRLSSGSATANISGATNEVDKNFKFIIKKCGIPQAAEVKVHTPFSNTQTPDESLTLHAIKSKSADNIIDILRRMKGQQQRLTMQQQGLLQATKPPARSRSVTASELHTAAVSEKSLKSLLSRQTKAAAAAEAASTTDAAQVTQKDCNSANIRTVGRSLVTWRRSRRHHNNRLTATANSTKSASASVYVCKKTPMSMLAVTATHHNLGLTVAERSTRNTNATTASNVQRHS